MCIKCIFSGRETQTRINRPKNKRKNEEKKKKKEKKQQNKCSLTTRQINIFYLEYIYWIYAIIVFLRTNRARPHIHTNNEYNGWKVTHVHWQKKKNKKKIRNERNQFAEVTKQLKMFNAFAIEIFPLLLRFQNVFGNS